LLAIGHLSPGLAVVTEEGETLWQAHPKQGNATDADTWLVAIDADGDNLYAVSAMASANCLVALEPQTGTERARRYLDSATRIAGVAALPNGDGALVAFVEKGDFGYEVGRLILYNANLSEAIWERHFDDPEELITALCVDEKQPVAAIALGAMGKLQTIDALTGRVLADNYAVKTMVYCLHLTQGRYLAAATESGCVDMLQYRP
jgi:outer membrane protein assembly factor BamB